MRTGMTMAALLFGCALPLRAAEPDIVVADFEADNYGDWTTSGTAFGEGPAQGTLPGQMPVNGYRGSRLVNSFLAGDASTGTLRSPPFELNRHYLTFLIGGGGHAGATCIDLLVDGNVVRTATGLNTSPGGSEQLDPHHWDVHDLRGRSAVLRIVDKATGGWGHINIDHIVLSDRKPKAPNRNAVLTRDVVLDRRFLLFPIQTGARPAQIDLHVDGQNAREFTAELARHKEAVSFWAFLDVSRFAGKSGQLRVRGATEESLALIELADTMPASKTLYRERLRPQFHFSQRVGWNNDPNGMVYLRGEWHLFFQHNPYGWNWGNMHWGHAVSRDLVHWEQLPIAIYNNRRGDYAFSGGAVIDERNTAGWQTGGDPVIVASWTSTGRGECIAYSNDRGRTFIEYDRNPVVEHRGRDPKILWYQPGEHWVMVVYDESPEAGKAIAFYTSENLKAWQLQSKLSGYYECPELVELAVDGDLHNRRWVVFAADARYTIGAFDGKTFTPEHQQKHRLHYGNYYASQLFSNAPGGRRIQIGWARIAMQGMPFNQTFSFPHELTLRSTDDGLRLFAEPVREIKTLYRQRQSLRNCRLTAERQTALPVQGELFDIFATFRLEDAKQVGLEFGAERVVYSVPDERLDEAHLGTVDGQVTIRVLVDRPMLEVIGNRGRVYITRPRQQPGAISSIRAFAKQGTATLVRLEVHRLASIWKGATIANSISRR